MRKGWLVISIVAAAGAAPRASAQSASVQAQSLFDEGRRLLDAGKIAEACAAFDSSQKLDPAITTLLNLADCREQNNQLATAWGTFTDANRMARTAKNDKLARVAASHAHKLEPRLSKLSIVVPADHQIAGLEVTRDGELINAAAWNHALPIDGGTYTISARAPGRAPWSITKVIKPSSDAATVTVPLLDAKAAVVAKPVAVTEPRPVAPAPVERQPAPVAPALVVTPSADPGGSPMQAQATVDRPSRLPVVPLVLGGGALALGGGALAFHLSGNHLYDQARATTGDQTRRDSLEHSANTRRYVAQAFAGAAIGCAGAAVYLYIRDRGRDETTAMTPVASSQFAGLAVVGRW
jgi:hypothetical protein